MSEDRTQTPSRRRRQLARERGLVPRSPELTSAVGLLAAVALLGAWGGDLASALVRLVRTPLESGGSIASNPDEIASALRHAALSVGLPLVAIVGGTVVAMVLAHQVQTGGLWAPALLAPDLRRLTGGGPARDPIARAWRGLWGLIRAAVVVAVVIWAIRAERPALDHLARLEPPALALASAALLRSFAYTVGLALLVLGLADYVVAFRRVEAMLRQTPDEQREEQRTVDGDPELRSRRLRLARDRLRDPGDALTGASLVLTGPGGLAVLLGGDPPPGRVSVRLIARGLAAASLRRAANRAGLPTAKAPALARWFADARTQGPPAALPPHLADELAALWPGASG